MCFEYFVYNFKFFRIYLFLPSGIKIDCGFHLKNKNNFRKHFRNSPIRVCINYTDAPVYGDNPMVIRRQCVKII